jgi:hypothetical protein
MRTNYLTNHKGPKKSIRGTSVWQVIMETHRSYLDLADHVTIGFMASNPIPNVWTAELGLIDTLQAPALLESQISITRKFVEATFIDQTTAVNPLVNILAIPLSKTNGQTIIQLRSAMAYGVTAPSTSDLAGYCVGRKTHRERWLLF